MMGNTFDTASSFYIENKGVTYRYLRYGRFGGVPLLLLQNFAGTIEDWDGAFIDALASVREVIVFDYIGVSGGKYSSSATMDGISSRTADFILSLSVQWFDVLGVGFGGMVAQKLSLDLHNLVRKLVLVSTAPKGGIGVGQLPDKFMKYLVEGDDNGSPAFRFRELFWFLGHDRESLSRGNTGKLSGRAHTSKRPTGSDSAQLAALKNWAEPYDEHLEYLGYIHQPVLVIHGRNDSFLPVENAEIINRALPDAELVVLAGDHRLVFTQGLAIAGLLKDFLD